MIGWRCEPCGYTTFDGHDITWPISGDVVDLVCPSCGAVGQFVDAECLCAGPWARRCPAHPFQVLSTARTTLPCGCQLVVDVERNATDWRPCPPCERTIGLVVGLVGLRNRTAEMVGASFVAEPPQSPAK
jgi:hypothetical protein